MVDSFHGDGNIFCSRASAVCGFVNIFYPSSVEAGKRLSRASRRSVPAGLGVREGALVLGGGSPVKPLTRLSGSCEKL